MRSRLLAISGTIVAGLAVPGVAAAAPTWLPPADLDGPTAGAVAPRVNFDADGNATAIWETSGGAGWQVRTATRRVGAVAWGAATTLDTATGAPAVPVVAFDRSGGALALWEHSDGTHVRIRAAWRPSAGAPWGASIDISPASQDAHTPQVAFDDAGNATALWTSSGPDQRIQTANRSAATSTWSVPVALDDGIYPARRDARVSVAPDGRAAAIWSVITASAGGVATSSAVQVATRTTATGSWSSPATVTATDQVVNGPEVVLDRAGNATATWARLQTGADHIEAITKSAAAVGWTAPTSVSGSVALAAAPEIGADDAGNVTVTWRQADGTSTRIRSAARSGATGLWSSPSWVSAAGEQTGGPSQVVARDGRTTVVWAGSASGIGNRVLTAVRATPTGAWGAPSSIAATSFDPQPVLATDPAGNAAAAWLIRSGGASRIQAAGFDGAGPLLAGPASVSVPGTGLVGRAVAMSAAPIDAWSAVAGTTWSFGDGTKASGTAVSHSYSTPGSYTVLVKSTDTLGLATTTTRLVKIK